MLVVIRGELQQRSAKGLCALPQRQNWGRGVLPHWSEPLTGGLQTGFANRLKNRVKPRVTSTL